MKLFRKGKGKREKELEFIESEFSKGRVLIPTKKDMIKDFKTFKKQTKENEIIKRKLDILEGRDEKK